VTLRLANVTIDCGDRPQPGWFFIKVPEGKVVKNRVHFDLHAEDREAQVGRLLALGAQRFDDYEEHGTRWTTLLDVEGNEFCVAVES
jgi:hypothetical protein